MNDPLRFGPWLKQRRKLLDLTQEALSSKVSCSTISIKKIESGDLKPSRQMAVLLANAIGVPKEEHEAFITFARSSHMEAELTDFADQQDTGKRVTTASSIKHALEIDHFREEAHGHLIHLARNGKRTAALVQYETYYRIMVDEWGVEPLDETKALYERLKETPNPFATNIPTQVIPCIGRNIELSLFTKMINDYYCRLINIVGHGGMGKTHFILHAASTMRDQFWHGIWFVSLHDIPSGHGMTQEQRLITSIADALSIEMHGFTSVKQRLLDYLRTREMVLILDSFEHFSDVSELILEILNATEDVKIIITSRERLNFQEECIIEMNGLEVDKFHADDSIHHANAVELFLQQSQRVSPNLIISPDDMIAITHICKLVKGMPLGITLAAAWVRVLSCTEIASELEQNLSFLTASLRNVPERHRSLRAVFDHSWQMLSPSEQQILSQLSVFRAGFRREAARAITTATLAELTALVDKSLLLKNHDGRYEAHEMVRQFAIERLTEINTVNLFRDKHAVYYAEFLAQQIIPLKGYNQFHALADISQDIENIRSAWGWMVDRSLVMIIGKALDGLFCFYEIRSLFQEGEALFKYALENVMFDMGNPDHRLIKARLQAYQGWFSFYLGQTEVSLQLIDSSLIELQQLQAEQYMIFNLNCLGAITQNIDEFERAQQYLEKSLHIAEEINDQPSVSAALNTLGQVAALQGNYSYARQLCRKSLEIKRSIGDRWGMASSLIYLGWIEQMSGDYQEARTLFHESLTLSQEFADRRGMAVALVNLGDTIRFLQDYQTAGDCYIQGFQLFKEIGAQQDVSLTLSKLGEIACVLQERESAHEHLFNAITIALTIRSVPALIFGLIGAVSVFYWHNMEQEALNLRSFIEDYRYTRTIQKAWLSRVGQEAMLFEPKTFPKKPNYEIEPLQLLIEQALIILNEA